MEARAGEITAITGRNGSGKTTLLEIAAGKIRPDKGKILYFGNDLTGRKRKDFSKYCSYLMQGSPLIEEISVQDNISLWTGKSGPPDDKLIDFFRLKDILSTRVEKLSGGMKRQAAMACALSGWAPVLILDEPTSALDIYRKEDIRNILKKYCGMGGTVIMVTHDRDEIEMSDVVYLVEDGSLTIKNKTIKKEGTENGRSI